MGGGGGGGGGFRSKVDPIRCDMGIKAIHKTRSGKVLIEKEEADSVRVLQGNPGDQRRG